MKQRNVRHQCKIGNIIKFIRKRREWNKCVSTVDDRRLTQVIGDSMLKEEPNHNRPGLTKWAEI